MKNILVVIFMSVLFVGCSQPIDVKPLVVTWQEQQSRVERLSHWSFSGKIALISPTARHSLNIFWQQNGNQFHIILTSFIGSTVLDIEKTKQTTRIITHEGKTYYSKDTDKLIKKLLGFVLPISLLQEWIKGNPMNAQFKLNENNLVLSLFSTDRLKNKWAASYSEYTSEKNIYLPTQLQFKTSDVLIKFAIQHWDIK
ncbi:MAG: outer membrane lipoprotein LolB [Psychromonas sp.]|nr:outer membrane lipoprotein LolB [Psychromonas sp.]